MTTHTIALENMDVALREAILSARAQPLVITRKGQPVYVIRNLLDDDITDELIARNPAFLASIRVARQQKAEGRVKKLSEVRAKYETSARKARTKKETKPRRR